MYRVFLLHAKRSVRTVSSESQSMQQMKTLILLADCNLFVYYETKIAGEFVPKTFSTALHITCSRAYARVHASVKVISFLLRAYIPSMRAFVRFVYI